nr:helix-turn-helix transcriptional regulator [uncultured Desulfuromonas sp.]
MKISNFTTDSATLQEIGKRLAELRISLNLTQSQLAANAGIGKRTLERVESGEPTQTTTLIRILRALGQLEPLDALLPETQIRPMQILLNSNRKRKRASSSKHKPENTQPWRWGDEE